MSLSNLKDLADAIQSLMTVIAIIIGGIWTYILFVRKREKYPRATITHHVSYRAVGENKALLSLDITIVNTSEILLSLSQVQIYVGQVLPPKGELLEDLNANAAGPTEDGQEIFKWSRVWEHTEEPPLLMEWSSTGSVNSTRGYKWLHAIRYTAKRFFAVLKHLWQKGFSVIIQRPSWPIEPGDSELLHYDILIDSSVQTVRVDSFIPDIKKRSLGWKMKTIHDLAVSTHDTSNGAVRVDQHLERMENKK